MRVNEEECLKGNIDIKKIKSIAMRISKAAKEAESMGVFVFGGGCGGTLRFIDDPNKGALFLADLDGQWEGGAGDQSDFDDGFLRGEL